MKVNQITNSNVVVNSRIIPKQNSVYSYSNVAKQADVVEHMPNANLSRIYDSTGVPPKTSVPFPIVKGEIQDVKAGRAALKNIEETQMDFSGMSDIEIFRAIYDKYSNVFGDVFSEQWAYPYTLQHVSTKGEVLAGDVFSGMFNEFGKHLPNAEVFKNGVAELWGMSNMTSEERTNYLAEEFAKSPKTEFDLAKFITKLCYVGCISDEEYSDLSDGLADKIKNDRWVRESALEFGLMGLYKMYSSQALAKTSDDGLLELMEYLEKRGNGDAMVFSENIWLGKSDPDSSAKSAKKGFEKLYQIIKNLNIS